MMASGHHTRSDLNSLSPSSTNTVAGHGNTLLAPAMPPNAGNVSQNPTTVYQQIHEVSAKRISTLSYLRKVHEGHVYWYNTLFFTRSDMAKLPFFELKKLGRRASNYLLLGLSLPSVLDLNSNSPQEYLRALSTLLNEYESYQQVHSLDGYSTSSLSRAKIPQMFKRAAHTGSKGRRTSSAAERSLPTGSADYSEAKPTTAGSSLGSAAGLSFLPGDQGLLPGEDYTYLLTPSLPFDPDFFETLATLCDILIDCYTRIMTLISSPAVLAPGLGELFAKADAKVRKILIGNIVKEFEDASRSGSKAEFAGVGRVIMGGLV